MLRKRSVLQIAMVACVSLLGLCHLPIHGRAFSYPQATVQQGYFVISNIVEKDNRDIYILLNQEYFTGEYLRELWKEISDKYPQPERLHVWLNTNIEQVRSFVNGRPYHLAELILERQDPTLYHRFAHGLLFRTNGNEVIRYYVPSDPIGDVNFKTIVVKGRDPAYSSDK